jgi:uncharacterized protein YndB with AHSA1/START domain
MSDDIRYVLERSFDAPPEQVWEAWTDEKYQSRWYGPGVQTIVHANDLAPGGQWLVEMKGDGWAAFQRADYLEVAAPSRLVFLQSMTDADWSSIANPRMPDWPRVMHTEITFALTPDGRTEMRLVWTPYEASDAERAFFASSLDGLGQGWGMGMDILDQLLAELQN